MVTVNQLDIRGRCEQRGREEVKARDGRPRSMRQDGAEVRSPDRRQAGADHLQPEW